jgi:hypothetical protein
MHPSVQRQTRTLRQALIAGLAVVTISWMAAAGSSAAPAAEPTEAVTKLFGMQDGRIDEASGLGVGMRSPGVLYVQNDSGDTARFFALDGHTGQTLAVCNVPAAQNIDWEDLAVTRNADGVASVWLADIGDNDENRSEITVYRVDEPSLAPGDPRGDITVNSPQIWKLRYPDGAHNAESFVVDPTTYRIYVITKSLFGNSRVYQAPAVPSSRTPATLKAVADIRFSLTGTAGGPNAVGQLTATGASMSADGSVLVVRTYTDAYFWRVGRGDVAAALRTTPIRSGLPPQPLGEGIAIRAGRVLIDSEKLGSEVYSLALPAGLTAGTPKVSTATTGSTPLSGVAAGSPAISADHSAAPATRQTTKNRLILLGSLVIAGLVVFAASRALLWMMRRRLKI